MNNPTSILEQAQRRIGAAGKWGAMVTTTRRCVCALALMLLFLAVGVGSALSGEARTQESLPLVPNLFDYGLTLQTMGNPAWADTLTGADQRARFKTH